MAVNPDLNKTLKEMWRLDELIVSEGELNADERAFYNQHLDVIKMYYQDNNRYWDGRRMLAS